LEEKRPLSNVERNFRVTLKTHQKNILEAKILYWRKRANIRWEKLGDENIKFFHAISTRNYRHNYISHLTTEDGRIITKHGQKAAHLWNSFKERLGKSVSINMMFDLNDIVNRHDLSSLGLTFTKEEIDEVIKHMPNDKVSGPDGFNGKFFKKYWNLFKQQFYDLLQKFYEGDISLESLNTAFIVLIQKNPETSSDYRPISLVSMALKVITKIIANMVQKVIIPILHQNQYGFIKNKTIHDFISWAFEYLHICHKSKKSHIKAGF
jgi:hypothetical protein